MQYWDAPRDASLQPPPPRHFCLSRRGAVRRSCRSSFYSCRSRQIVSGWGGKDTTEVVYPDIVDMKYVWRFFGR